MLEIAALVVTGLIGFYGAIVATAAVLEARRLRQEQTSPEIAVYLEEHPDSASIVQLVIHNTGQGSAHHIRFKRIEGQVPQVLHLDWPIHILTDQLPFLAPEKSLRFSLGQWHTIPDDPFTIEATYVRREADDGHKKHTLASRYVLDPKLHKGLSHIGNTRRDAEKALVDAMKALKAGKIVVRIRDQDRKDEAEREYFDSVSYGDSTEDWMKVLFADDDSEDDRLPGEWPSATEP